MPLPNGKPEKLFSIIAFIRAGRPDKDSHQCTTGLYSYHKKLPSQTLRREKPAHGWAERVGIKMVVFMQKPPYNYHGLSLPLKLHCLVFNKL